LTLFRFAHIHRARRAGGVESHLHSLNRKLLERNRMVILQMYLTYKNDGHTVETEHVARGTIVWIPSLLTRRMYEDGATRNLLKRTQHKFRRHMTVCHNHLLYILSDFGIDLAVFHWLSKDSPIVMDYLDNRAVPLVVVNHFDNARLKQRAIRKQLKQARAVAGITDLGIPYFIRGRFTNLSAGIDTDFFDPQKARPLTKSFSDPVVLLPARLTEGKGHMDAIHAIARLRREGTSATLVFAGRLQSEILLHKLRLISDREGIGENVVFAGELSPEELRDWYGAAALVVLPSETEGLGRVLLETQAMCKPAVAYAVGGTPAAIQHGSTGWLVPKMDMPALAQAIGALLKDPQKMSAMGKKGRQRIISDFSLEAVAIRHEVFYHEALMGRARITG